MNRAQSDLPNEHVPHKEIDPLKRTADCCRNHHRHRQEGRERGSSSISDRCANFGVDLFIHVIRRNYLDYSNVDF